MTERFNSGDLIKDINDLICEINILHQMKSEKEATRRRNQISCAEQNRVSRTLAKVEEMISEGVQIKYERHGDYANNVYGLKTFNVALTLNYTGTGRDLYQNRSIHHMRSILLTDIKNNNNSYGQIIAVEPYNKQFNVTEKEYDHTVEFLRNILPINVTMRREIDDSITFDTGRNYIWINIAGQAYITGISLTERR